MSAFQIEGPSSVGSSDGWTTSGETWTYASASTFTVSGDVTAKYGIGTLLKFTQTTVKYAVVSAVSHAAGTTTVTIAVNTDYTLANAAISANYYSYQATPQGFPARFAYTPTWTGFSAAPSGSAYYTVAGRVCTIHMNPTGVGTSNATSMTMTVPFAAQWYPTFAVRIYNNGAFQSAFGFGSINDGTSVIDFGINPSAGSGFTSSGGKAALFSTSYIF